METADFLNTTTVVKYMWVAGNNPNCSSLPSSQKGDLEILIQTSQAPESLWSMLTSVGISWNSNTLLLPQLLQAGISWSRLAGGHVMNKGWPSQEYLREDREEKKYHFLKHVKLIGNLVCRQQCQGFAEISQPALNKPE